MAHPHVFVEARSKLIVNDEGLATGVEHVFRFDDAFTAFAIQGFDKNGDGKYSREELSELAKVNVESMAEFGYFTFGDNTRRELDFTPTDDYWLEVVQVPVADYWVFSPQDLKAMREDAKKYGSEVLDDVQLLELHFTLNFKHPTDLSQPLTLDVYDPTYYVDFRFSREDGALSVMNAPGKCSVERRDPPSLDAATRAALAQVGADVRQLPANLQPAAATQVNQMIVTCPDAPVIASADIVPDEDVPSVEERSDDPNATPEQLKEAKEKLEELVNSSPPVGDVQETMTPRSVFRAVGDRIFGQIAELQARFYQKLINALRKFKNDPHAGWLLVGISLIYGVFHAAGPGHGKAVISSYVIANDETLKKGIMLSFIAAFAQAMTAIILVGGLAVIFNLTSLAIQDTARWLEIGSYAVVTALGVMLMWKKGLARLFGVSAGHDHDHHHGPGEVCATCGHSHAPSPAMVQGRLSLRKMASIVLAVGLRPCSGALIVLVFAFGQNMIGAGIGASFAMSLGTGFTVSLLAALAVFARGTALRVFGDGSSAAGRVARGLEFLAALFIFLMGVTLLTATLGWGS